MKTRKRKRQAEQTAMPSQEKIKGGFDVLVQIRSWVRMCRIPEVRSLERPSARELIGFIERLYYEYEQALAVAPAASPDVPQTCEKCDAEMLRVKACEHIADGDEGWEKLENTCASTMAVAALRRNYESAAESLRKLLAAPVAASPSVGAQRSACGHLKDDWGPIQLFDETVGHDVSVEVCVGCERERKIRAAASPDVLARIDGIFAQIDRHERNRRKWEARHKKHIESGKRRPNTCLQCRIEIAREKRVSHGKE